MGFPVMLEGWSASAMPIQLGFSAEGGDYLQEEGHPMLDPQEPCDSPDSSMDYSTGWRGQSTDICRKQRDSLHSKSVGNTIAKADQFTL